MVEAAAIEALKRRFLAVSPFLDERTRRLMLAGEALALGPGIIVSDGTLNITGLHHWDSVSCCEPAR